MQAIIKDEIQYSDLLAIADSSGNRISYKELAQRARSELAALEERSLIFILCDYQMETVEFIYEIMYLNRVPLLLSSDIDAELLDVLIQTYQPQYLYCQKSYQMEGRYREEGNFEEHVLWKTGNPRFEIHPDVALLLSTSGTTGSAKLVKLSYDNIRSAGERAGRHMGIVKGQKGLCPSPLNHILGFIFCMWHWSQGASILVTEEFVISKRFQEFYREERINNFAATPYIFRMLQKVRFWDEEKVGYLHRAVAAGEKMPEEEQEQLRAVLGDKMWLAYGQTECAGYISDINIQESCVKKTAVGKALEHIEATADIQSNELIVKSKCVCMGYANNVMQLAQGDVHQGILHTGDMVRIDADGCIYLMGRLTRYVKVLGKRVNLDDIENYLRRKLRNVEFACVGEDNRIMVFHTCEEDDLNQKIRVLLDHNMKIPPKYIVCTYLEEMPRSDTGKILYRKLEQYEGENN